MYARVLATLCLLSSSIYIAMAGSPERGVPVSLRLRTGAVPAAAREEMEKELSGLMSTAGVTVRWEDPNSYRDVSGYTVVVDLDGDCSVPFHTETAPLREGTPIGSTAMAESHLLPFIDVNCDVLGELVAQLAADQPEALRQFVLGRALGRVLAHELYHIVAQSQEHSESGVTKASLSAADLMNSRFEFNETALDRMHASRAAYSGAAESAAASLDSGGSEFSEAAADGK